MLFARFSGVSAMFSTKNAAFDAKLRNPRKIPGLLGGGEYF
jgi:hypothetical protein